MARILIIDDEIKITEILQKMFEKNGYEAVTASDGKEGLDLYRKAPADLVITDILMPNKEGVETIFELRRDFPDVKIIVISGGGKIKAEDCIKTVSSIPNVRRTFRKPFALQDLLKAVKEILAT